MTHARADLRAIQRIAVVTLLASAALLGLSRAARGASVHAAFAWTPSVAMVASPALVLPASAPLCLPNDDISPHRRIAPRAEMPVHREPVSAPTRMRIERACVSMHDAGAIASVPTRGYDATAPPA